MINEVRFWDRMRAESHQFTEKDWVISITSPTAPEADIKGAGKILRVSFSDVVEPVKITDTVTLMPMTEGDARTIVDTVVAWDASRLYGNITVHCDAGASRSAAVAMYIFTYTMCYFPTAEFGKEANKYMMRLFQEVTGLPVASIHESITSAGGLI